MIIVETVGRDVKRAELRVELVLKIEDSPTPEALSGSGPLRFKILHASPEERALLLQHGIALEDVDLKWAELHHRQPVPNRRQLEARSRTAKKARARAKARASVAEVPEVPVAPIEMKHAA